MQFKTICTGKPNFLFNKIAKISTPPVEAFALKIKPIPTPTHVVPNLSSSTNASTTLNSSTTQPTVSIPSSSTTSLNINSNETKPNANLSSAISKTKEFSEGLKRDGVNVIIEELDMTDEYRIVFRIKKQAS